MNKRVEEKVSNKDPQQDCGCGEEGEIPLELVLTYLATKGEEN